jgi:hypothetical protein
MGNKLRSEDLMLIFGLDGNINDFHNILKEIGIFFENKQGIDTSDRFNFVAFNSNRPVYFDNFTFDYPLVVNALKELKENLVPLNVSGGLYLALTFVIDVFRIVSGKVFRIIVLMDDQNPEIKNIEVVQNIFDQVRDFPVIVDFIRYQSQKPNEDRRLSEFAQNYGGKFYFAKNTKDLKVVFEKILGRKKILKFPEIDQLHLVQENEMFFYNLALEPVPLEITNIAPEHLKCQICHDFQGELVVCPKCGTRTHAPCLALWAKISKIGVPHVFRCMQCFSLLKLPKPFVLDVQSGEYARRMALLKMPTIEEHCEMQTEILRQQEKVKCPTLTEAEDPFALFDDFYAEKS